MDNPEHVNRYQPETDFTLCAETAAVELSLAIRQFVRQLRTQGNPETLTLSQISVLNRLGKNGVMTTSDLARVELMKPQSMGTLLAGLKERGLVWHRPHPTDGRQVQFTLTPQGADATREHNLAKREWLRAKIAGLDDLERETLIAAIPIMKFLGEVKTATVAPPIGEPQDQSRS